MPHSLDLFRYDGLDEDCGAFDLDVDMNEPDTVDILDSMKSGTLISVACDVSTFLPFFLVMFLPFYKWK